MTSTTKETQELVPLVAGLQARCPRCGSHILAEHLACPECGVDPLSERARARTVPVGSRQREVLRGISYLPRGLWQILKTPASWGAIILPLGLNIVFVLGVTLALVPQLEHWLELATIPRALADLKGWLTPLRYAIIFMGWLFRTASYFAVPGLTAWALSLPPFRIIYAALGTLVSERIERSVLGLGPVKTLAEHEHRERSVAASVLGAVLLMCLETVLYGLLLPIALIPVAGSFVWLVVPRAIVCGVDQLDPSLCRKAYSPREKAALLWARRYRFLGLGAATFFVMGTPYFNAFIFPVAAAGATLLYLELDAK
ncbi:MAG TPA: EI24 domain-containing protein [Planctomycetota bacterium]|nr:EI24 domain-containing protein [Planctomycetota bacterium]